jgi:hypothetical protein
MGDSQVITDRSTSERAARLAAQLDAAASALIRTIHTIDPHRWDAIPVPGVWSVGKDAEHITEAIELHVWIVRVTIGEARISHRPPVERRRLTSTLSQAQAAALIRSRATATQDLVAGLTDRQLDLVTRPERAGAPDLATTIERTLIGHVDHHRAVIEAKLSG